MILMLKSQGQIKFSPFDLDFSRMSDFKATEMQLKPEPIDLFKMQSVLYSTYALSFTMLIDLQTSLKCQDCITFKNVYN